MRLDKGVEYYGRYTMSGQTLSPFAKFLQEQGIVASYIMLGSLDHKCVTKRRNWTLIDMVRSIRSHAKLPKFLWRKKR